MRTHTGSTIFLLTIISFALQGQQKQPSPMAPGRTLYGFIENKGQIRDQNHKSNSSVRYLLSLPGTNVVLKSNGFSYDTYVAEGKEDVQYKYHRVDVEFVGAKANPVITGIEKSSTSINYYQDDREVSAHHYRRIIYEDVYPGIDVEFIARPAKDKPIEYNFIVHPGADVNQIQLAYNGANESELTNGKVELQLAHGNLTESIPLSYYLEDKKEASFRYRQISAKHDQIVVGFEGDVRVPEQTLVIDPIPSMTFSTNFGGPGDDGVYDITVDASGNMYVTGFTTSSSGIATSGSHQVTHGGGYDNFVMKLNSAGVTQWATYYGGVEMDYSAAIELDVSGNVYVTGATHSKTSISTAGAHQVSPGSAIATDRDGFLVKFNNSGVRQWGTYYGGAGSDEANWLAIDGSGNLYLCGVTASTTNISTAGSHQASMSGTGDAFLVKFNSSGVRQWGTYYGGTGSEAGLAVAVDPSGNIVITGLTSSTSGIATAGTFQTTFSGLEDAFVVKFNTSGVRQWGTYYGGTGNDQGWSIVADASSNIYISGNTLSTSGIASAGTHQTVHGGGLDAFVAKLNSSGGRLWGTYYGGTGGDGVRGGIVVSVSNDVIFAGTTTSTGMASPGAWATTPNGGGDVFFSKLASSTGTRIYGTYLGIAFGDSCEGIATDASANIYIAGSLETSAGSTLSAFIQRYSECVGFNPNIAPDATTVNVGTPVIFTAASHTAGNNYAYTYSVSGTPTTVNSTTAATSITFPAGVFTVTTVTTNSGCSHNGTLPTITVRPVQPCVNDVTFCQGETVILIPGCGPVGSTYNWFAASSGGSSIGSGNLNLGALAVGTYTRWVETLYNGASSTRKQIDFQVHANPTPNMSPNATTIYLGSPVTFTAANHQAGNSYQFTYLDGTPQTVNSTTAATNITLQNLGLFTITCVTTSSIGCTSSTQFNIQVIPAVALCQTTIPFTASGTMQLDKYAGQFVLTPSGGCPENFVVGCVSGKVESSLLSNVVSASATAYSDQWSSAFAKVPLPSGLNTVEKNERGKWRPQSMHSFNKPVNYQLADKNYEAGRFQLSAFYYKNPEVNRRTGWLASSSVEKYTPDGDAVQERNALNIANAAKVGYGRSLPYLVAQNAEYGSVYFEGFENVYNTNKLEEGVTVAGGTRASDYYHSGKFSLSLTGTFTSVRLTVNKQMRDKGMQVRFWAKGDVATTAISVTAATLTSGSPAAVQPTVSVPAFKVVARSGEWALLESTVTAISAASDELTVSIGKGSGGAVWVDDVRIQPLDAEMSCYVYDNRTLQLLAAFDDQHFGMFYQYNTEGKLIRKMVETERGIKTMEEKQYNLQTISKSAPLVN